MPARATRFAAPLALALLSLLPAMPAVAEGVAYQITDPVYHAECSTCHVAYPPRLLGVDGWREIFGDLHHHFGVDLDLRAEVARHLADYTAAQAGPLRLEPNTPPRLTLTHWFVTTHRAVHELTTADHGALRAPNCPTCHRRADYGDYTDGSLRVPHRHRARTEGQAALASLRPGESRPTAP